MYFYDGVTSFYKILILEQNNKILILLIVITKKVVLMMPSFIIKNGILDQKELSRQRMCISELIGSLRQQGISDIAQVEYAILEENGKLSVFKKSICDTPTCRDLNLSPQESGISHALIIDKIIIDNNLKNAGWTRANLASYLNKIKKSPKDILLFTVTDDGETNLIYKEENKQ